MEGQLRHVLRIALLVALAGSSWWLLRLATPPVTEELPSLARQSDAYLDNFTVTIMDKGGRVFQVLEGARMVHYVGSHTSELTRPKLTAYDTKGTPWYARSETGLVDDQTEQVTLLGSVEIDHVDLHGRPLKVRTRDVELDTLAKTAATDQDVEIAHYGGVTRGTGLRARMADGTLSLLANVRGEYVPSPP